MLFGLVVFAAIVVAVFSLAATYNSLVAAAERTAKAWNNLDAVLRERHDEIPALIEICEPHLSSAGVSFDKVREARAATLAARQTRDAETLGHAERKLRAEIADLIAAADRHPVLGKSPAFALIRQSNATLNQEIAERQGVYNEAVLRYNAAIGRMPGSMIATLSGFAPLKPLDSDAEAAR
jgi:LemA protein